MNKKIICTRGVPASGKTTWANAEILATRFNKDDIRNEFTNRDISLELDRKAFEKMVIDIERDRVELALEEWIEYIIIDNTHLKYKNWTENKHISFYKELAKAYWYEFEIKEFYINQEVAILRDKIRWLEWGRSVWEKVIRRFFKNMTTPRKYPANPTFKPYDKELEEAVIVDIDWTLAFMDGKRSPYDYSEVKWDRFNYRLWALIKKLNCKVIILSGREDWCEAETISWLTEHRFNYELHMRKSGDNRCDTIVKKELYWQYIENKYNVLAVFDDRDRVVDTWRELGLPTYQVWYWDF